MIEFDEAFGIVTGIARPGVSETIDIFTAAGLVLAAPVLAGVDSPPVDVSSMDGYAVRESDATEFKLVGTSWPGDGYEREIVAGEAVRIFTGAPVPAGADRVIIQENVDRDED